MCPRLSCTSLLPSTPVCPLETVRAGLTFVSLILQLTEDPSISVLVIEAGESDQKQLMSKIPAGWVSETIGAEKMRADRRLSPAG